MENLDLYNKFAPVPENAKKKITGGKLNGKTDINPLWRIKSLTEAFGPCGFGWYTEIKDKWTETADGESAAWVRIHLFIKHPESGEWSKPIEGVGGSKQNGKGQGEGINDEAFKMAETDAISVACKKLGMAASVYWDKDDTKYTKATSAPAPAQTLPPLEEGNQYWVGAIDFCRKNNLNADALKPYHTFTKQTADRINEILGFSRELNS